MSRKQLLPYDVRQECLWIVRGYDRRVKAYYEARREIIDGTGCSFCDTKGTKDKPGVRVHLPHGSVGEKVLEGKIERLEAIEDWPETKKMRAVENAKLHIGLEFENEQLRKRLADGILLNCQSHREYPYSVLNLPGISERTFRRRKDAFLVDIAKYLGMV